MLSFCDVTKGVVYMSHAGVGAQLFIGILGYRHLVFWIKETCQPE